MLASPKALWDNCLTLIRQHVSEQHFNTWFKPIVFESYKPATKTLLVRVPSTFFYESLEANFVIRLRQEVRLLQQENLKWMILIPNLILS